MVWTRRERSLMGPYRAPATGKAPERGFSVLTAAISRQNFCPTFALMDAMPAQIRGVMRVASSESTLAQAYVAFIESLGASPERFLYRREPFGLVRERREQALDVVEVGAVVQDCETERVGPLYLGAGDHRSSIGRYCLKEQPVEVVRVP
jgi:hypothetical protein